MFYGFVYETTNLITGKKYIGKHKRTLYDIKNDPGDSYYLGSGKILRKSIEKYGKENFSRRILCECSSEEELTLKEKYYIDYYDAVVRDDYYNLCRDADPPVHYGPQSTVQRSHISNSLKGNLNCLGKQNTLGHHWQLSEETKKRQSIAQSGNTKKLGYTTSEYTRGIMSNSQRDRYANHPELREILSNKLKGKKNGLGNISKSGQIDSPETLQRKRESHLGKKDSEDTKQKKREAASRRVYNRVCVICNESFTGRSSRAKYCPSCKGETHE